MMQITDLATEDKIPAVLRLGFRPFFLSSAIFAILALILWLLMISSLLPAMPFGGALWWHLHEMIFGFATAVIAGFLLTAVQTWTGIRGIHGVQLLFLFMLWLTGRLLLWLPDTVPSVIISLVDLSFLPAVAFILARPLWAIKQYRNLFFVPLLMLFTLVNVQMHLAHYFPQTFFITSSAHAGIMLTVFLMSVIAGRVTPMFTANGTQTTKVTNIFWLEQLANGAVALVFLTFFLAPMITLSNQITGALFIIAGLLQAYRVWRWRPWLTLKIPLLWSLHGALQCLWMSLLLLGLSYYFQSLAKNHLWHLLTIGTIMALILAMMARVSLGHTGRELRVGVSMKLSFILIIIAAFIRSIAPLVWPANTAVFYGAATVCATMSFALFVVVFMPKLITPRADKRPG